MMRRLSIDGPNTGDWFAVAFISWTDPNNDRIEQQGKRKLIKILFFDSPIRLFFIFYCFHFIFNIFVSSCLKNKASILPILIKF